MSRSGYCDYWEADQWEMIRWRGAVESALRGKRGQAFLREMIDALDDLPEKKLIAHELVTPDGECCALGAVALRRGLDVSGIDPEEREQVAGLFGIAEAMAAEVMFLNDDMSEGHRWRWMRDWAERNIRAGT